MVRFYNKFSEQLYILLLYCREQGLSFRDARLYASNFWTRVNPQNPHHTKQLVDLTGSIIANTINQEFDELQITDFVNDLGKQLYQLGVQNRNGGNQDKDLIDTIVRILQLPYVGNALSSKTIDNLRKALLLPDEMAALLVKLKEVECVCGGCKHRFTDAEAATFRSDPDTGTVRMYCSNCVPPLRFQCAHCGIASGHNRNMTNAFKKHRTCPDCQEIIKAGGVPKKLDQHEHDIEGDMDPVIQDGPEPPVLRRGGRIFGGGPLPPRVDAAVIRDAANAWADQRIEPIVHPGNPAPADMLHPAEPRLPFARPLTNHEIETAIQEIDRLERGGETLIEVRRMRENLANLVDEDRRNQRQAAVAQAVRWVAEDNPFEPLVDVRGQNDPGDENPRRG